MYTFKCLLSCYCKATALRGLLLYFHQLLQLSKRCDRQVPPQSAHHVVGEDGQQQLQFIRVDVDVGLDCISRPDGSALKHLAQKKNFR